MTLQLAIHDAGLYRDNAHFQRSKLGAKGLAEVTDIGFGRGLDGDTDLRLTEIAARVGYRSEFSFSRTCKSARGVSSTLYRRAVAAKR